MKKKNSESFKRSILNKCVLICFLCLFINSNTEAQKEFFTLQQTLANVVDSFYTTYKLPGVIVGIWTPDFTFTKTIGKADLKTGVDRKFNDMIRIGSITKTFVATVILQLVDEGKLKLDDKLDKYYPQVPNASIITLRQVLDMTSGIPDYFADPLLGQSFTYDRLNKFTPQEILDASIAMKPSFPPGTKWEYSNSNYNILGMLIEKITGNKLEDEINSRLIKPLELVNTSFPSTPYMDGQYSHGYMRKDSTGQLEDVTIMDPSITWAAGDMISNINDLKIWAVALANGRFLSKATQNERLKFVDSGILSYAKYGLGILYLDEFIGHSGGITGYNTSMYYNPELKALFIVSVNELGQYGGKSDNIFMELAKIVYPGKNLFK